MGLEDQADAGTDDLLVVGNDDTQRNRHGWATSDATVTGRSSGDPPSAGGEWTSVELTAHRRSTFGHATQSETSRRAAHLASVVGHEQMDDTVAAAYVDVDVRCSDRVPAGVGDRLASDAMD